MIEAVAGLTDEAVTATSKADFLIALALKGETADEIAAFARELRERAVQPPLDPATRAREILDVVGTGGDRLGTFNISTTSALIAASAGITVAKHGNRAITSRTGSADVLEALGVNLAVTPEKVEECIREAGIGFLFAPALHGAMKHAIGPRREIGIRTIFNILGPLTNPARADRQVLGVYRADLVETLARVLARLGCRRGFVVHGEDGMDELTLTGATRVAEIRDSRVTLATVTPELFGFRRCALSALQGGDAVRNAAIVRAVLAGEPGPQREVVLLNAAFALVAAGVAENVAEGIAKASVAIDSGAARRKLERLAALTNA